MFKQHTAPAPEPKGFPPQTRTHRSRPCGLQCSGQAVLKLHVCLNFRIEVDCGCGDGPLSKLLFPSGLGALGGFSFRGPTSQPRDLLGQLGTRPLFLTALRLASGLARLQISHHLLPLCILGRGADDACRTGSVGPCQMWMGDLERGGGVAAGQSPEGQCQPQSPDPHVAPAATTSDGEGTVGDEAEPTLGRRTIMLTANRCRGPHVHRCHRGCHTLSAALQTLRQHLGCWDSYPDVSAGLACDRPVLV